MCFVLCLCHIVLFVCMWFDLICVSLFCVAMHCLVCRCHVVVVMFRVVDCRVGLFGFVMG